MKFNVDIRNIIYISKKNGEQLERTRTRELNED